MSNSSKSGTSQFAALFRKVGGIEILKQYLHGHVLLFALVQTLLQGFSKKSLELVRLSVSNRILKKLRKKSRKQIAAFKSTYQPHPRQASKKIWVCWLQGMDKAPALVQRCYRSLQEHLPDREIVLITKDNYKHYVQLPAHIEQKVACGIIGPAHFSDLLRLELLIQHGGTWIDATVFCSGGSIPAYMLDAPLFMFQNLKPGLDGHPTCISNWFISAQSHSPLLSLTQQLLYDYWSKHNTLVDYFIFHLYFQLAIEAFPQEWKQVVPVSNALPHILLLRLFEPYNAVTAQAAAAMTPFHKLSYKFSQEQAELPDTYYQHIIT